MGDKKNVDLEKLQNEIKEFYLKIENELISKKINEYKVLYKMFYSKFSIETDILFIGINPGAGEPVKYLEPLEKFEYIDQTINDEGVRINNYRLAQNTIQLFNLAGYPDLLNRLDEENKVVKTNFYHLITENLNEMYSMMRKVSKELEHDYYHKVHHNWISRLIELTNPKLIICEGESVFDLIFYIYNNTNTITEFNNNDFLAVFDNKPFRLIGYKRDSYSHIVDKESFAKTLKTQLDEIYK